MSKRCWQITPPAGGHSCIRLCILLDTHAYIWTHVHTWVGTDIAQQLAWCVWANTGTYTGVQSARLPAHLSSHDAQRVRRVLPESDLEVCEQSGVSFATVTAIHRYAYNDTKAPCCCMGKHLHDIMPTKWLFNALCSLTRTSLHDCIPYSSIVSITILMIHAFH